MERTEQLKKSEYVKLTQFIGQLIGDFRAEVNTKFAGHDARFAAHDSKFAAHDARFDGVDRRFDSMDRRFDQLEDRVRGMGADIMTQNEKVLVALDGIGAAIGR